MSIAAAIEEMIAEGFTIEQAIKAAKIVEANLDLGPAGPTARQARNRRYYEAHKCAATRTAALRVWCPFCLAKPGDACGGKRGSRASVHRDRLYQATQS
jgi:hypothetical protein